MRPADTDPKSWDVWLELMRQMPPGEKLVRILTASAEVVALQEADERRLDPSASDHEVRMRAASRRYGPEILEKAFGWRRNHVAE